MRPVPSTLSCRPRSSSGPLDASHPAYPCWGHPGHLMFYSSPGSGIALACGDGSAKQATVGAGGKIDRQQGSEPLIIDTADSCPLRDLSWRSTFQKPASWKPTLTHSYHFRFWQSSSHPGSTFHGGNRGPRGRGRAWRARSNILKKSLLLVHQLREFILIFLFHFLLIPLFWIFRWRSWRRLGIVPASFRMSVWSFEYKLHLYYTGEGRIGAFFSGSCEGLGLDLCRFGRTSNESSDEPIP